MNYDFYERLQLSKERATETVAETLLYMIPGAQDVTAAPEDMDKKGVDFVVTIGDRDTVGRIYVDLKARTAGCSTYWKNGPELALETWSVMRSDNHPGKIGWTLDTAKHTDMTLHIFDPTDTKAAYLLPFHHLRIAFKRHGREWCKRFKMGVQNSGGWQSECVFVPASYVVDAVAGVMNWHTDDPESQLSLFGRPA